MATIGHYEKLRALCGTTKLLILGGVREGESSQVVVFDHVANKTKLTIDLPSHVLGVALLGSQILCACADGKLRGYDSESGMLQRLLPAHSGAVSAVAVADAQTVYTAGVDGYVRRYSLASPTDAKLITEWQVSKQPLRCLAVSTEGSGGEFVAAAGDSGIVSVVTPGGASPQRDMPGHEGAVTALAFTPRDGRLCSGGEDGTLRLWYLVGAIECETRSSEDKTGAVLALLFPPTPISKTDGTDVQDRIVTACADGKVRVYRLDERRKPRTLECGTKALPALGFLPPGSTLARTSLGAIVAAGDSRTVYRYPLELDGSPGDKATVYEHGFDAMTAALNLAKPAREAAYKTLAALEEPEALEMLLRQLSADREKEPTLRVQICNELGTRLRRPARAKLRESLNDTQPLVRKAALLALRRIEGVTALSPLRAALGCRFPDLRQVAVAALLKIKDSSPLVPGLITGALTDSSREVRTVALDATVALYPAGSAEPLRLAFERGPADIRSESLVRGAFAGLLRSPELSPLLAGAQDDADAEVRWLAFALSVLLSPQLSALLETKDPDFARTTREIAHREVLRKRAVAAAAKRAAAGLDVDAPAEAFQEPNAEEIAAARKALTTALAQGRAGVTASTGTLTETDLQPLLTAMACRTPSTALRGARGLALLADMRALGALLQLSREGDVALRRDAAAALQVLPDPRAKKRLMWMLDDVDASVRAAALEAYTKVCGTDVLAVADAALQSSHEDIRVRGLDRLIQLGADGKRTAQVDTLLGNALEDEAAKVRSEALRTLWSWQQHEPAKVIERALSARFPDLRLRAVEELERLAAQEWASARLLQTIGDRDADVAKAAYDATLRVRGKADAAAPLLAVASTHRSLRELGARGAKETTAESVRAALVKLLDDEDAGVRTAALETLDRLLPKDSGAHYSALQGAFLDLRVRAAELLAARHDERLIAPMRTLLADKTLRDHYPADVVNRLRLHAAMALATLGAPSTTKYLATELVKDEHADVREQAARGLATAARPGDEGYLLDLLGHQDIWVRSWAADGLSRLGDARALPVLTGTLRHDHLPIRFSAIISFAALGPEGYGGMLQGLEDPSREVQEIVFALVLARDLQAFRRGQQPDLLASALSSQRAEVRFSAARALELRTDPETFLAHVIAVLQPPKPEKAADMKDWPREDVRGRMLLGLAEALASDRPDERYAAAQVLRLRRKPQEYFREAARIAKPRAVGAGVVPDTTPRGAEETDTAPKRGWLRRLLHGDEAKATPAQKEQREQELTVSAPERARLLRLSFGAYVGLLRQVADSEDERVRRDAVDRIVELGLLEAVGLTAALPAVVRALDDPHYLVRKAAFAGLRKLYPVDAAEPLLLAVRANSADVARLALDEFATRGEAAWPSIGAALSSPLPEVRRYAFELLEKQAPAGSLEPLLLALQSEYADLRIGVIERLATQRDPRVTTALQRAMQSDHDDLRLRAAELLAARKDDQAAEVLGLFLRSEDRSISERAQTALLVLGSERAVQVLAARLERDEDEAGAQVEARVRIAAALGETGHAAAVEPLAACLTDDSSELRNAAFAAALELTERAMPALDYSKALPGGLDDEDESSKPPRRDGALLVRFLRRAVTVKDVAIRQRAAEVLDQLGAAAAVAGATVGSDAVTATAELLLSLFADRQLPVQQAAVQGYSRLVIAGLATVDPLLGVLRAGTRELLLSAAEGAAAQGQGAALRPLLLLVRAGEEDERGRALLALGSLGDPRALQELETIAAGGTKEAPAEPPMQAAAVEALGRILPKLTDPEAKRRVSERVEELCETGSTTDIRCAAIRGLRSIGGERVRARLSELLLNESLDDELRLEAAKQLGRLGDQAAEGALAEALNTWDDDVRLAARRALYRLFPSERIRVEFLAIDCRRQHEDIIEPAVAYLLQEAEPAQLLPRLATLKDYDLCVRLQYGLLRRQTLALEDLLKLLSHTEPRARTAAGWLLGARAGSGATALSDEALATVLRTEQLEHERWQKTPSHRQAAEERVWEMLLWAVCNGTGGRDRSGVAARLRQLLSADALTVPASIRQQAARGLALVGSAADAALLQKLLLDAEPGVRTAAASALSTVSPGLSFAAAAAAKPFDAVAFAPVAGLAQAAQLTTLASRQLGLPTLIGSHQTGVLQQLLASTEQATRLEAAAALGRAGGSEAMTALRALAFDKKGADEQLRKAAYRAYRRARRHSDRQKKYEAQP